MSPLRCPPPPPSPLPLFARPASSRAAPRAAPALSQLVKKHDGQTIFVVAHETTNRLMICKFVGLDPAQYRSKLAQRPACLNLLQFPNENEAQLMLLNDIGHYGHSHASQYEENVL